MNSTQNKKIEQVKETTMIVGIDVGSEKHYFRAFNWRGIELTRKPVAFSNSMEGFNSFYNTIVELMQKSELEEALVGIEPTGHYWFDLGQFMGEKSIKFVMVNPHHVHKTKELDDNSPSKNDRKDPRVIAGLVRDGRYFLDCQHFFRQIFLGYFSDIVQAFDTLRKNVCGDDYTSLHNPIVLSSVLPAYGMFHSIQILFL